MKNEEFTIGAYYYPGWHNCLVRDENFPNGWSEWDLVYDCKPAFSGHEQPNIPLMGRYNEESADVFSTKTDMALSHGINLFVFAFYWSRGKRLLGKALDNGFLKTENIGKLKFALMWANRMPRRVLPVKNPDARLIDPQRLVHTDPEDFLDFIKYIAKNYFQYPGYFRYKGASYLSIFDTNFFLRQMGIKNAEKAIENARGWLLKNGFGKLHLAAIDPAPRFFDCLVQTGFDSVTHYVNLPRWKGPYIQDFSIEAKRAVSKWPEWEKATSLPYIPSVSPGWDATPRGVDFGKKKPGKYPWSPVITGRSPYKFGQFVKSAIEYSAGKSLCFISSWNEWSEGHYLEPDTRYKMKWLEAVAKAKSCALPEAFFEF